MRVVRFSFIFGLYNGFHTAVQLNVLVSLQSKRMSLKGIFHGIRNINRSRIQTSFSINYANYSVAIEVLKFIQYKF